jgi:hypothetical protein
VVIEIKYDRVWPFSEGMALVREGTFKTGRYGYMNKSGAMAIAATFTGGDYFKEGLACVSTSLDTKVPTFQFIDKKGAIVINKNFKYLTTFKNGVAKVSSSDIKAGYSNGYIDKTGKYVWPQ